MFNYHRIRHWIHLLSCNDNYLKRISRNTNIKKHSPRGTFQNRTSNSKMSKLLEVLLWFWNYSYFYIFIRLFSNLFRELPINLFCTIPYVALQAWVLMRSDFVSIWRRNWRICVCELDCLSFVELHCRKKRWKLSIIIYTGENTDFLHRLYNNFECKLEIPHYIGLSKPTFLNILIYDPNL